MFHQLLCLVFLFHHALALDQTVDLGYARYRGAASGNGILRWAGMRYARSVSRTAGMRFVPAQDPLNEPNVIDATKFGPLCIGSNTDLKTESGPDFSEDCLFINVFAPANATTESNLPVYVFIQGGGFNSNGNANYNGSNLVNAGDGNMVVVNFNYRVGPYGFLASREVVANQSLSLNNGLKDQRQALKWVQKYIKTFGGDPNHVTLGGASAGGGSDVLHLTAYGGRNDNLFQAVLAESAAFPPLFNVSESQYQYDALLTATGCADLPCMASMDAVVFQKAVRNIKMPLQGAKNPPIFFWSPTLDYDFIADYTLNEIQAGHVVKVPTIFGDTTNEGIIFVPTSVTSEALAQDFIHDQFPTADWDALATAWSVSSTSANASNWRNITADIYGHIRYICPNLYISSAYASNTSNPTWQYRWNYGTATHVSELNPIWNNGVTASGVFLQRYWASFIRSYDPSKYPSQFQTKGQTLTSPAWTQFNATTQQRMLFGNGNDVAMEDVTTQEMDRCKVINAMGLRLKQRTSNSTSASASTSTSTSPSSPKSKSFGIRSVSAPPAYLTSAIVVLSFVSWACA